MSNKIRETNDSLRAGLPIMPPPHKLYLTEGIASLPPEQVKAILEKIRLFDKFDESNDPYEERDFGDLWFEDEKIFWKFDYYDSKFENHQEDGTRVLTVMFASEY